METFAAYLRLYVCRMLACCENFGEPRKFSEPIHLSDVYLPVHATQYIRTGRGKESKKAINHWIRDHDFNTAPLPKVNTDRTI